MKKKLFLAFAATGMLLLSSCSFFQSREAMADTASNQATREYFSRMVFNREGLSFEAENFLKGNEIYDTFEKDPLSALYKINAHYQISGDPDLLIVSAELCRLKAIRSDREKAVPYYLCALYYIRRAARESMARDGHRAPENHQQWLGNYRHLLIYNEACYGLFKYLNESDDNQIGNVKKFDQNSYVLYDAEGRKFIFNKSHYHLSLPREEITDFLPCADFRIQDLRHKNMKLGLGLPLIGIVKQPDGKANAASPLRTPPALTIPVTLVPRFTENEDHSFTVDLYFQDTLLSESFEWQDQTFGRVNWPLALDFSTPLAHFLGNLPERNLITLMLNPDKIENECGLYMLEPYQPNKIPVVFVHGLMSSPDTWTQMINSLRSDPIIRQRYQFWFYYYSSGVPVIVSGKKLHASLLAVQRDICKSEAEKKNFEQMVIVGHSMGGLITRTMIQQEPHQLAEGIITLEMLRHGKDKVVEKFGGDPDTKGNISWSTMIKDCTPEEIDKLEKIFAFPALPIHRVIFMAVPHRGSKMAKNEIAQFGSWLISLPVSFFSSISMVKSILRDDDMSWKDNNIHYTGIDNLDPDSNFALALAKVGIKEGIIYHSIIGNAKSDNQPCGSDGVVPYDSSHLDNAASELVVKSGHSVHRQPAAIREVMRILRLHLQENQ